MDHDFGYGQYVDLENYAGRVVKHYIPLHDHTVMHIRQPVVKSSGLQRFRYQAIIPATLNPSEKSATLFEFKPNLIHADLVGSNNPEKFRLLLSTICIVFILIAQLWAFHGKLFFVEKII